MFDYCSLTVASVYVHTHTHTHTHTHYLPEGLQITVNEDILLIRGVWREIAVTCKFSWTGIQECKHMLKHSQTVSDSGTRAHTLPHTPTHTDTHG